MQKKSYNLLVLIAFAAVIFPMLKGLMSKDKDPHLAGLVTNHGNPDSLFKPEQWFSGEYQNLKDDYNNDHWAFKGLFVRLNNQFYYDLFNQIRVNGFVSGKENYIFSEGYIFSAFGDDYVGQQKIQTKLQKAKVVQDSLKRKGIDLLLVFAPGKGEYCIEQIEDKYKHPILHTNYQDYINICKQLSINVLDLKAWFHELKPHTPYPLFTKFGHHWSYYAECLVIDTVIGHIEHLHGCDMPDIVWNKIDVIDTARSRDADVLQNMNLYKSPDQNMKLAYPLPMFEKDSIKNKTRVLTIADSYWYGPVYLGIGQRCFGGGQFWYYYNKIVPNPSLHERVEVWQLDLKQHIENNQVIMLLYSDGNLPNFANTFIEDAYEMYTSPASYNARMEKTRYLKQFEKRIREQPAMLKKAIKKSFDLQIPLDSAIRLDAMKLAGIKP